MIDFGTNSGSTKVYTHNQSRCMFQRVMKRPDLRHSSVGLVILIRAYCNNKGGRFMPRPLGAKLEILHCVVPLEKDESFPSGYALFKIPSLALNPAS